MAGKDVMQLEYAAEYALKVAGPSILEAIRFPFEKSRVAAHVVILDPRIPFEKRGSLPILAEQTFGEQDSLKWTSNFKAIAHSKAIICWRTGLSTRAVGEKAPFLYEHGDTKYSGGVVCDGLIVAVSGMNWELDEACAHMVIAFFWAHVRHGRDLIMQNRDQGFFE